MEFEPGWAILAGLVGGAVMAVILYVGIIMMPQQMKMNLFMMLGSMVLPVGAAAFVMGAMVHAGMSVVFGLIHGAIFAAADIDSAWAAWGLLFGVAHWAVVGMALGMMPMGKPADALGLEESHISEGEESDSLLSGMEMDDESIRSQQILQQIREMVKRSPESATDLVSRWINRND